MILITGANGIVGSAICKKFVKEGHNVSILLRQGSDISALEEIKDKLTIHEGDILDLLSLEKALKNIDTVIHCAAMVSLHARDKKKMFKVNIEGTKNIIDLCLKFGIKEFVQISSVAALGNNKGAEVVNEKSKWTNSKLNSPYGESKYLSEIEVWRGMEEGLNTIIVNPSVVLGKGSWERSSGQIFNYIKDGNWFYTDGKVNYIDSRDVAESVFRLYENKAFGERYILNAGTSTYHDLFNLIAKEMGRKPPSIRANTSLLKIAFVFEKIKSMLTGKPSLITRETILLSEMEFFFDNKKLLNTIEIEFHSLQDTIKWICDGYASD